MFGTVLPLFSVVHLLKGVSGQIPTVYSRDGDDVTLTCHNVVYPNCSSTTWIFSYNRMSAVELVSHGKIRTENREIVDRLSLGSDCSLNINKVRPQDAGFYTCQQYLSKNRPRHGDDAPVLLHVLKIILQHRDTEMKSGSTVTLSCLLFTENSECKSEPLSNGLNLIWVNETGTDLNLTDSRLHISPSIYCPGALTVRLQDQDNNRKWTCQLTDRGEVKISVSYITKWTDITSTPQRTTPLMMTTAPVSPTQTVRTSLSAESTVRLTIFSILMVLPVIIGAAVYVKRRIHQDQGHENMGRPDVYEDSSVMELPDSSRHSYVNLNPNNYDP